MSYKNGKNGLEYHRSETNPRIRHRAMIAAQEEARAAAKEKAEKEAKEKHAAGE